ncbi:MAG: hypothetical protein KC613_15880, partial [Myxococcales bacterium]|nr:hypothetical protein [Myxococcales bacterium]
MRQRWALIGLLGWTLLGVSLAGCDPVAAPRLDPAVDRGVGAAGTNAGADGAGLDGDAEDLGPDAPATDAEATDAQAPDAQAPDAQAPDAGPPSPLDRPLADEIIYFVLTDRFANGDPTNDLGGPEGSVTHGGFDPTAERFWHGGDLRGLTAHLDYLQGFGITALWITPVVGQRAVQRTSGAYHGYWGLDFERVDPHLGTEADLVALVQAAHAREMKVFLDVVLNHTADVIQYAEGRTDYRPLSQPAYTPVVPADLAGVKAPAWLNDPQHYNNRGNSTFTGESTVYGDFHGLDDLDTRQPAVVAGLTALFADWVRRTGVDGFRVDTVKHVDLPLWPPFVAGVRAAGAPWFTLFGEIWEGDPAAVGRYVTVGRLPSALDFPLQAALRQVVSQGQPPARLAQVFARDDHYLTAEGDARNLVTFLGNHDMGRFAAFLFEDRPGLSEGEALARLRLGHALLFFTRGAPAIYYGDEQGFVGSPGGGSRQDMLPTQVPDWQGQRQLGTDSTPARANHEELDHPLREGLFHLGRVRRDHPALRHGVQLERFAQADGTGIYACSRAVPGEGVEYLVVVNTAAGPQTVTVPTDSPSTAFVPAYGELRAQSDAAGRLTLTVPGLDFAVLRAEGPMSAGRVGAVAVSGPARVGAGAERISVEARVEAQGPVQVQWWIRGDGVPERPAGIDLAPPYRLDLDATGLPEQGELRVRAEVGPWDRPPVEAAELTVTIDRRVLGEVALIPPTAGHTWARALTTDGRPAALARAADGWTLRAPPG